MSLSFAQLFKPRQRLGEPDVHPAIVAEAEKLLRDGAARQRLADHDAVTARGSAAERLAFLALSRELSPGSLAARRRLLDALPADLSPLDGLVVERAAGVLVTGQPAWAPVAEAVEEARACFADARRSGGDNPGKLFMTTAKLPRPLDSKIMALARHPAVLRLIGRYLGGLPILYRINLLDSANEELQPDSSQFFHVDPEDFRQLKIFLLVEDVDADSGPLHLLRADASDAVRVARAHRHGRVPDEEVLNTAPPNALVACTGPSGTLAIGDTSRCFHFGSRPGSRRRHVVMIQYLTAFASLFPLDAQACSSKYAAALRQRAEAAGAYVPDLDAHLFGLKR
ncbi:MAG TPA: hypothetical protein VGG29_04235 [Caulobacteraceae bacterium]